MNFLANLEVGVHAMVEERLVGPFQHVGHPAGTALGEDDVEPGNRSSTPPRSQSTPAHMELRPLSEVNTVAGASAEVVIRRR